MSHLRKPHKTFKLAHGDRHRPAVPGLVSHREVQLLQHPCGLEGQGRVAMSLRIRHVPLEELLGREGRGGGGGVPISRLTLQQPFDRWSCISVGESPPTDVVG